MGYIHIYPRCLIFNIRLLLSLPAWRRSCSEAASVFNFTYFHLRHVYLQTKELRLGHERLPARFWRQLRGRQNNNSPRCALISIPCAHRDIKARKLLWRISKFHIFVSDLFLRMENNGKHSRFNAKWGRMKISFIGDYFVFFFLYIRQHPVKNLKLSLHRTGINSRDLENYPQICVSRGVITQDKRLCFIRMYTDLMSKIITAYGWNVTWEILLGFGNFSSRHSIKTKTLTSVQVQRGTDPHLRFCLWSLFYSI